MENKQLNRHQKGFTLIELMVVLIVIGILATFALPSYFEYVRRAHRAEMKTVLFDAAQYMQRFYAMHNSFAMQRDGQTAVALPASLQRSPAQGTVHYRISLRSSSAITYELQAVPVDGKDPCGIFLLNHAGQRNIDISKVARGVTRMDAVSCWR